MQWDNTTSLQELRSAVAQFVHHRDWERFHTPKNLAMSIAIEAAELMEHFQWLTAQESERIFDTPESRFQVADELADILIYCLAFANRGNIDLSQAVLEKLKRNELRFPRDPGAGVDQHQV